MEEKRVYCCLATRIPGSTSFFVSVDHRLPKNAQLSHFYEKSPLWW